MYISQHDTQQDKMDESTQLKDITDLFVSFYLQAATN